MRAAGLIFMLVIYLGVRSEDETIDVEGGHIHNDVDNAMRAFSAFDGINCRNSINALYADSATIASNAKYSERSIQADYSVYAERSGKAGHAFKSKRSKYSKFALFAYEADNIVKRREMARKLPKYGGPEIEKIDGSQFMMRRDNNSCHCGGRDEVKCKNVENAFKTRVALEAVNCTNSLSATKAINAGNAQYADLANFAETAGSTMVAKKTQRAKISDKSLKAIYSVLAEKAEFALRIRRNPNKPVEPDHHDEPTTTRSPVSEKVSEDSDSVKTTQKTNVTEEHHDHDDEEELFRTEDDEKLIQEHWDEKI